MCETHSIRLVGGADREYATFELLDVDDRCVLNCRYRDKTISADEGDFFEALVVVRRQLRAHGLIPRCYGASLNVYPSGMARDMGQGLKAYKLTMGKPARMADLVEIFADGPDVVPADADAQEQFWRKWLDTPRE